LINPTEVELVVVVWFGRIRMVKRFIALLLLLAIFAFALGGCVGGGGGETTGETTSEGTVPRTTGGGSVPAELTSAALELTPSGGSGVSGSARLTNRSGGGVQVELYVLNLQDQPGTEHIAHIHQGGTCADDRAGNGAPVEYPLNSIFTGPDGTGLSTTTISNITVAELFSGSPKYINVHAEQMGNETPPGISCADLSSASGSASGGTTSGRD
jgi:Cu/Zn superoxide dismutase